MVKCFAARTRDERLLRESSSGGIFSELARPVLDSGGCVFGCIWKKPDMVAVHVKAETWDDLSAMRGSKYVRSDIADALRVLPHELASGRQVLFVGTPCQVAAVRRSLAHKAEALSARLILVELICHGAPDPRVWEAYKRTAKKPVAGVFFKDKRSGWSNPTMVVCFADHTERVCKLYADSYVRAFESGLSQTDMCFSCPFKSGKSGADITIGDLWGGERVVPEWNDDKGVSCVIVHTSRGAAAWSSAVGMVHSRQISLQEIVACNPNYAVPIRAHPRRERFRERFEAEDFDSLVKTLLGGPFVRRLARRFLSALRRRIRSRRGLV